MTLSVESDGAGPRIVLVHGFTQTRRCWGPEAAELARDHEVVRVDAPGHGRSRKVRAGLLDGARLIVEVGGAATYLGYSMGARFCLHVALARPDLVPGLVLIGATPGIEDVGERQARREQDLRTAGRIEAEGVEPFLDAWLAQPLFSRLPRERAFVDERSENSVEGLVSSLTLAGTGSQDPSWHRLSQLTMPVLVVAGALDSKFSAIAQRMVTTIGDNAALALIPEAGHAAHLEQPDAFLAVLRPWLADHGL